MADDIGIPRRRDWRGQARRIAAAAARRAFIAGIGTQLPQLLQLTQRSESTGTQPMKRRRGTSYEFEMGEKSRSDYAVANRKYVKKCMRTMLEKKSIVVQNAIGNSGVPTSSGRVDPIQSYNISQGTGDGNRTGNFIEINKITLRFNAFIPVGTPSSLYRVIVFQDRQTNGATPAVTDVIQTGTGGISAGYNADNVTAVGGSRFRILSDKWFVINAGAGAADASSTTTYKAWTLTLKGKYKVHYDTNTGAIADIVSGEIFILTGCNGTNATIQCQEQIAFVDA